ncbi:hypothetical protein ACO0LF_12470 [Undibacterium sp. Di27W]|uniref:hypothetical protein n=1 Tax=Undibacterium sp. Di27W TaxID=3413036 RepID=UPI003BF31A14
MIAVLDACLINGFGLVSVTSAVVAGNVATLNVGAGHSFTVGTVALIAGVISPAELNGEARVTAVTPNSVSFTTTGIGNQTATGTITAKLAGAGWAKAYTATNTAAYKATDTQGTGCYLRLDDTATIHARAIGYEAMTDINTGTGSFPTNLQVAGGYWWQKSGTADATPRTWMVFTDTRMFYLVRFSGTSYLNVPEITHFGDIVPTKTSGDPFACAISGNGTALNGSYQTNSAQLYFSSNGAADVYLPRSYTGLGSAIQMLRTFPLMNADYNVYSGNVSSAMPFPNGPDGGVYTVNFTLTEYGSKAYRGNLPGLYAIPQNNAYAVLSTKDLLIGQADLAGRFLRAVVSNGIVNGAVLFDTTGPWR